MNSNTLKKAKETIKIRRLAAVERLKKETAKAQSNAEYRALEQEIKLSTYNLSKAIGRGEDTAELERVNKELSERMRKLKNEIGLADNYNVCARCGDTGTLPDGRLCNCLLQAYFDVVRESSGVQKLPQITFHSNNIKNIDCEQRENLITLYNSMEKYCANFPNNEFENILLRGKIGTGKSYLMSAVANEILNGGYTVQYLTAYAMSNLFDAYFFSDVKNKDELVINSLINADLLIIDDLGTETIKKNITLEHLLHTLDERAGKHTIITTNLTNTELKNRYGERIFSRMCNRATSKVLALDGDDLRILRQK